MGDPTEIFIGIDVAKARNAIAVADGGRGGKVRFIGEVDASPAEGKALVGRRTTPRRFTLDLRRPCDAEPLHLAVDGRAPDAELPRSLGR